MSLRVVGAGLGRTGTHSLKLALEHLLGGRCYHMVEVFQRPPDVAVWHAAALGEPVDWHALMADHVAAVDWPAAAFWRELADANPDALILLSTRDSASWWRSSSRTIWEVPKTAPSPGFETNRAMIEALMKARFVADRNDEKSAIAAYERHNDEVRRTADPRRLLEWRTGDGWEPICKALGVSVPERPFPHTNTSAEFRGRLGLPP